MAQSAKEILRQALLLPDDERAELVARLLDTLRSSPRGEERSDEEWIAEIERRARAALSGATSLSWEEAREEISRNLQRK